MMRLLHWIQSAVVFLASMGTCTGGTVPVAPISGFTLRHKRIVIIDSGNMGDLVDLGFMLRTINEQTPDVMIDIVCKPYGRELLSDFKNCNFIILDPDHPLFSYGKAMIGFLFGERYDACIYPRYGIDARYGTLIASCVASEVKIWFHEKTSPGKSKANRGFDSLYTHSVVDDEICHQVKKKARLLVLLGYNIDETRIDASLPIPVDKGILANHSLAAQDYFVIWFGATECKREWKRFEDVIRALPDKKIVICGELRERPYGDSLAKRFSNSINLCGATSIRELYSILYYARFGIGTDTGIAHIANATGLPHVFISCHPQGVTENHTNSPVRFGPFGVPSVVLQPKAKDRNCLLFGCQEKHAHCILGIEPETVLESLKALESGFARATLSA